MQKYILALGAVAFMAGFMPSQAQASAYDHNRWHAGSKAPVQKIIKHYVSHGDHSKKIIIKKRPYYSHDYHGHSKKFIHGRSHFKNGFYHDKFHHKGFHYRNFHRKKFLHKKFHHGRSHHRGRFKRH